MSEAFYILVGLLLIILLATVILLYKKRNFIQEVGLLGAFWRVEARDKEATADPTLDSKIHASESGVKIGEHVRVGGSVGDVAGRDIVDRTQHPAETQSSINNSSVDIGSDVTVKGDIGDIAGRDISKDTK